MALVSAIGCADENTNDNSELREHKQALYERPEHLQLLEKPAEIARTTSVRSSTGELISESTHGAVTPRQKLAAANPTVAFFTDRQNLAHHDVEVFDDGSNTTTINTYLVSEYTAPVPLPTDNRELRVSQSAWDEIGRAAASGELAQLLLKPKGVPFWDIPVQAAEVGITGDDLAILQTRRNTAIHDRELTIARLQSPLIQFVAERNGEILSLDPLIGWMQVTVPVAAVNELLELDNLSRVSTGRDDSTQDNCVGSCTQPAQWWPLGWGRVNTRLGVDRFLSAGYDGGRSNSGFHSQSRLNIAVMERATEANWNDEAKVFLSSSSGGSSRISKRQACFSTCANRTNMSNSFGGDDHNVNVASIALGNLENQQGYGHVMADMCYSYPDHCSDWEERGSGMAPEAQLQMWADVDNANRWRAIYESVYETSGSHKPDVINFSTSRLDCDASGCDPSGCNPASSEADEDYIEIAELNGVLIVNAPRNLTPSGSTCNLDSPGDLPATFTVGALNGNSSTCPSYDLGNCSLRSNSPQGGMDLNIGSGTVSMAMSGIDVVAPSNVAYHTINTAGTGEVQDGGTFGGTSAAAPHVSGLAIDLKDWGLSTGQTWVNSPGRLHTLLLAMTDRDFNGTRIDKGRDNRWGLGKLRSRLFDSGGYLSPWRYSMQTRTIDTTGTLQVVPFSSPLASSTKIVKCVLKEDEYFLSKSDASDITMRVRITSPTGGTCSASSSGYSRSDSSFDLKHMAAIEDTDTTLSGKCVTVDLNAYTISSSGSSTVHAFCYSASRYDYE